MQSKDYPRLRECPFCGGEVYVYEDFPDSYHIFYTFACDACGMYVEQNECMPKAKAIEAWNRRAHE